MKYVISAVVLCAVLSAQAQTAKVIPLSAADAAEAARLYAEKADVEKKIAALREHVIETYLTTPISKDGQCQPWWYPSLTGSNDLTAPSFCINPGWAFGFDYSDDFKYIVPSTPPPTSGGGWGCALPIVPTNTVNLSGGGVVHGGDSNDH